MKKTLLVLFGLAIALLATPAKADPGGMALAAAPAPQAAAGGAHSVVLTWTASADAASNPTLTYSVYQATTCVGTFAKVSSGIAAVTSTVSGLQPGSYCYQVTAEINGAESKPSNQAPVVILPAPPTNLAAN